MALLLSVAQAVSDKAESVTAEYMMRVWDSESGLPFIAVTAMAQTADGYLWLGSYSGLVNFDGHRFTDRHPADLPVMQDSHVLAMLVARDDSLWVGSSKGVARYHKGAWRNYGTEQGLPEGVVRSLAQAPDGRIYLTSSQRVFREEDGRFVELTPALPRTPRDTSRICFFDRTGVLWCHDEHEIGYFSGERWHTIMAVADLQENAIVGAVPARSGGVWVADQHQIRRWHDGRWQETIQRPNAGQYEAIRLLEDKQGNLWLGGYVYGVWVYLSDEQRWLRCTMEDGLQNNATLSLFQDDEENVWVGSNGGGVARLRPRLFTVFDERQGLAQPIANAIIETAPGRMLVATHGGGLLPFDGREFGPAIVHPQAELTERSWVHAVAVEPDGALWLGLYDEGLVRLHDGEARRFGRSEIGSAHVYGLLLDSRGHLWIGTAGGVASWRDGVMTIHVETAEGHGQFHALAEDAHGVVWALSRQSGLWKFDQGKFQRVPNSGAGGIRLTGLENLFRDHSGALWLVGRDRLLARQMDEGWWVYPTVSMPPLGSFVSLVEDEAGDLWAGSSGGIYRISRISLDAVLAGRETVLQCDFFDRADGMLSAICRSGFQQVSLRTADGRLWFSTIKGLVMTKPELVAPRRTVPRALVQSVRADGVMLPMTGSEVRVPAGTRRVDIRYTGVSLGLSERVSFSYQVGGIDTRWVAAGTERVARLPDLRPGRYVFRLKALSPEGREHAAEELPLLVAGYFWQTHWFHAGWIGGLVALVGGGIAAGLNYRHRRESERLGQAAALAAERTRAMQAREESALAVAGSRAKSDFLATMSHEIRTPLNGVIGSADLMLGTPLNDEQRTHMVTLRASAEALLAVINDILDFSKIEAGHVRIESAEFDLGALLADVIEVGMPRALQKDLELVLMLPRSLPARVVGDAARLRQILLNLTGNAIKFTEQGHVILAVELLPARDKNEGACRLVFTVSDTGQGISPGSLSRLFERFSQVDSSSTRRHGGTGLGLAICRRLADLMGGSIAVTSALGRGSVFRVELPFAAPVMTPVPARTGQIAVVGGLAHARLAAMELLARAGYTAAEAATWAEITGWLRKQAATARPLVLLDESLLTTSAAAIGQDLRNIAGAHPVPVVLLTSRPAQSISELGYPVAAVLRKPLLRPAAVAEVLQTAFAAGAASASAPAAPGVVPAVRFEVPVLLADDEAVNRLVVRKLLESLGCQVDIAVNGAEAVALARLKDYAVIFMDCRMPEMDGFAATLEIRRHLPKPPPIVAITANNTVEDREHCLQVGMCDFISKPVRRADMQTALEKWVRPPD